MQVFLYLLRPPNYVCVSVLSACASGHRVCAVSTDTRRGSLIPWVGVTEGCEPPCGSSGTAASASPVSRTATPSSLETRSHFVALAGLGLL